MEAAPPGSSEQDRDAGPGAAAGSLRSLVDPLPLSARPEAVRVLARAFRDNPLNVAVIGGTPELRERVNTHGMRMTLGAASAHGLLLRARAPGAAEDAVHGALIGLPPGRYPLPPAPLLAQLRCTIGQGWRVMRRWGEVHDVLRDAHPVLPHWYVFVVGVDPQHQRHGLGGALLEHLLARIDATNAPAYLETDREENVVFYARAGFAVVDAREIFATPIWTLWREPAARRDNAGASSSSFA